MKYNIQIIIIILSFVITSCFKEDEKIIAHDPGDVKTVAIELTNDYRYQVYYNLGTGSVVSTNLKKAWDLGFECSPSGTRIILNSSSFMVTASAGPLDFNTPIDTVGFTWRFDASSGNLDSTAFGDWFSYSEPDSMIIYSNNLYVIDRGYDEAGNLRGLRRIVFQKVTDTSFTFRYADFEGSNENIFTVIKDPAVNYICFSFDDGGKQMNLEPAKESWDLIFTQYTTLLYTNTGEPYPYLLTGVLNNPSGVTAAQDTVIDFSTIDLNLASAMLYTSAIDEIGYDWKDVVGDVSSGSVTYIVKEGFNYVVRDADGFYYKLRFISFYNNDGDKGYPTFEYQRL